MNKKKFDIYQTITDKFIASLKKGKIPWKKPYSGTEGVFNYESKRAYHGINRLLLGMNPYDCPAYATYKQIQKLGGQVKKGESGSMVVYWNFFEKKDKITEEVIEVIPFLKYFTVFNLEQTTGIDYSDLEPEEVEEVKSIDCAEKIIKNSRTPEIQFVGGTPCYIPSTDEIKVPTKKQFNSSEEMYSTLFHEMTHSTSHISRLNRNISNYAREELVAEIGASFLNHHCGFGDAEQENSEAYVNSWIQKLSDHPRMIVEASGKAVKAVNYILNEEDKK